MAKKIELSKEEVERIKRDIYHFHCPLVKKRLHAIYLKSKFDLTNEQVGRMLFAHRNSITEWVNVYQNKGIDGLYVANRQANKGELGGYSAKIKEMFDKEPPHTIKEARARIAGATGITRSETCIRNFLKGIGFRYLKTGHIPAKANREEQLDFMENRLSVAIDSANKGKIHLLFMDAAHFVLGAFICSLWSTGRRFIPSAAGRDRINVLGAVNATTKKVTTLINTDYIGARTIKEFLGRVKLEYCDMPVTIVLDNARYQHCQAVEVLAKRLGIELLFLPPYSPNLNIIERLWKYTKKEVLNGKYYDKPKKFHDAIRSFFDEINQPKRTEDLMSLLTLKFPNYGYRKCTF